MTNVQNAFNQFFSQFADNVYLETLVPEGAPFPRVTYSFATSDIFTNILTNFQIWDRASNTLNVQAIADRITEAIPVQVGTQIEIKGGAAFEWYNPSTGTWIEFAIEDFVRIATEFRQRYGGDLEWREVAGKVIGTLRFFRGSPFLQYRNTDEINLIVMYGNIEVRSNLPI